MYEPTPLSSQKDAPRDLKKLKHLMLLMSMIHVG